MDERSVDYAPIADHAVIGNLRTAALVALDGTIDWCCLPELDDASVFGALLDRRRGGRFAVAPARVRHREQHYVEGTNVLETRLDGERGRLVITDFMPLDGSIAGRGAHAAPRPQIVRLLACEGGPVDVAVEWTPRFDYARAGTRIVAVEGGAVAEQVDGASRLALAGLPRGCDTRVEDDASGPSLRARYTLRAGERVALVTCFDATVAQCALSLAEAQAALASTIAAWRGWLASGSADREWTGPWRALVERSELVLRLLTHGESGALAAAATTSLPEALGGVRNWDYRFAWVRDAALTGQCLLALGHPRSLVDFLDWVEAAADTPSHDGWSGLRILWGLRGERGTEESELDHLEGYRGSRPVRIGNAGGEQRQHDTFGELIGAAFEAAHVAPLRAPIRRLVARAADSALAVWREPDHGIWEMRSGPMHYVSSRVKCWEALDLAAHMAEQRLIDGPAARWRAAAADIASEVLAHGYDDELGAFVMAYERRKLDAANLELPLVGFLPPDDPRVLSTVDRTLERLTEQGLVYRYRTDDGLPGTEGAFGLTTFRLVDALALCGRREEAEGLFERMASRANHVGLFSEQIDPASGAFLGNFPQAFTHVGLVNSLLYLGRLEGRRLPLADLFGADRRGRRIGVPR